LITRSQKNHDLSDSELCLNLSVFGITQVNRGKLAGLAGNDEVLRGDDNRQTETEIPDRLVDRIYGPKLAL
jgi:hypothetical protein